MSRASFHPQSNPSRCGSKEEIFSLFIDLKFVRKSILDCVGVLDRVCIGSKDDHKGSQRQLESRVVAGGTKENAMGEGAR